MAFGRGGTAGHLVPLCIGVGALAVHASHYWPWYADDAFISLRYAERLALGEGLTFTDGERVEGYSNLLWVLLLAPWRWVTEELVLPSRVLGFAAGAMGIGALVRYHRARRAAWLSPALVGALLLALGAPYAAWTITGLEAPLANGLLAVGLALTLPLVGRPRPPHQLAGAAGATFALLVWTRPDAPVLVAALLLGWVGVVGLGRAPRATLLRVGAPPVVAFALQLAFRLVYYGEWVPNTAHAKVAFTAHRIAQGWTYLDFSSWLARPPALVALLAILALPLLQTGPRRRVVVLLAVGVTWAAYVVGIGGDNMPQRRFLGALVVVGAFLGAELLRSLGPRRPQLARAAAVLCLVWLVGAQVTDGQRLRSQPRGWIDPLARHGWTWKGRPVGRMMRRAFADTQPLIAVDAAGALPYYSRLPTLDMLGLTDRYLATHPPPGFGTGWPGHELGDGDYVWRRAPDLIFFGNHVGYRQGVWRSGWELVEFRGRRFRERYHQVFFSADGIVATVWARRVGGRVGAQIESDLVSIPGWHFARRQPAAPDPTGRLGATLPPRGPSEAISLELDAGEWTLELDAVGEVSVVIDGQSRRHGGRFVLSGRRRRSIRVQAARGLARLFGLTLRRWSPQARGQ